MGRPRPPDPMQTARQQQGFNRDAQRDAVTLGQPNQVTPWGTTSYSGEPGSADRTQTVTLNPADQARLEQERSIKSRLLGMILGGAQGMNGQPVGGMQQAQGKQGQAQPMPAMNERLGAAASPAHAHSPACDAAADAESAADGTDGTVWRSHDGRDDGSAEWRPLHGPLLEEVENGSANY